MIEPCKRVVVAMSGGVDSSVAAALLKEQGCEVIGMTMQIWDYSSFTDEHGEKFGTCCSLDDVYDARRVAESLEIPFYVVNFEKQFETAGIDRFCDDYFNGRTPTPVSSATRCSNSRSFYEGLANCRQTTWSPG